MLAAAARVSYKNDLKEFTPDRDRKLLRFMLKHKHGTPFEHSLITFRVKAPLAIVQQMLRHRVGVSPNMESHRYKEPDYKFYVPMKFREQAKSNRQASVVSERSLESNETIRLLATEGMKDAIGRYRVLLELGVPREQARLVLPHGMYTNGYFTFNVRSLLHFVSLRDKPDAQWEIQQYAKAFTWFAEQSFPITFEIAKELT